MDTVKIEELHDKVNSLGNGISKFIRAQLLAIPEGVGVSQRDLATCVLANCPTVKDRSQAYARISSILKRTEGFSRMEKDRLTYVVRLPKEEEVA